MLAAATKKAKLDLFSNEVTVLGSTLNHLLSSWGHNAHSKESQKRWWEVKRLLLPALGKAEATHRGGCDRGHLNACSVGLWSQQNIAQPCIFWSV